MVEAQDPCVSCGEPSPGKVQVHDKPPVPLCGKCIGESMLWAVEQMRYSKSISVLESHKIVTDDELERARELCYNGKGVDKTVGLKLIGEIERLRTELAKRSVTWRISR